ncbi:hypothetical protein [Leeuwenhoekiella nanhaiensis]|uniref:Uncharacterized protein n=1 Tax=Leeuwenhoekiella nanhaiensis TaxID=1655491 RepID=A0A2G1VLZ1_9FLAO|nr:hypothetical protein [Leeuwenhoekiella nanhaiensis]PHQ27781.1 hypothetical protein CJ305_18370 [Leeuwenhoekiella nanhaiensis]
MKHYTEHEVIYNFVKLYLKAQKLQYSKKEIPQHGLLISKGILYEVKENKNDLEFEKDSINLQKVVLEVAENKLKTSLPKDVSKAFKFIDDFEDLLKKEYDCERVINSFSTLIMGLRGYVLLTLYNRGVDVKSFILNIDAEKRGYSLAYLEEVFFNYLIHYDYSEEEFFEIFLRLWNDNQRNYSVRKGLCKLPSKDLTKSKELLKYANQKIENLEMLSELLIGLYNEGETSILKQIYTIKGKDNILFLHILSRINFKNAEDVDESFTQLGELAYQDILLARQQSLLLSNIIKNRNSTKNIKESAFKYWQEFLKNGENEILEQVFRDIYFLNGYEKEKYDLLHIYLNKTKNFIVIKDFFSYSFHDPAYVFDIMMRFYNAKPDYRFSMELFENGIRHFWNTNQDETEKLILDLFKHGNTLGVLGVKTIFTAYLGIFQVDLTKLKKVEHQVTAIDSICRHPHSFDKLLPLILPLRNSKFNDVRNHLQKNLAFKVFKTYHQSLYEQIKDMLGNGKEDKDFLEPIKNALDDYEKLKELKESIDDLNPFQNERHLMDLYHRLKREAQAKMMRSINQGTFMQMAKNTIIVRGNSWMIREGEITPLNRIESKIQIDGDSYLNPDLFEHKLNVSK